jgi:AbiV family abortive infection protein
MPARKPLPTSKQAVTGSRLAASNAWTHINCAEALHEAGHNGAACSHLVLAVEEAVKARVLHRWPALLKLKTQQQLRDLLYSHHARHASATLDSMPQALRREIALWCLDHPSQAIDRAALTRLFVRHPDAFPITWAKNADLERQRGMHVDWSGRSWKSPSDLTEGHYAQRLRRCLEFVVTTSALVGMFDEIKGELAESGWNIDEEEL